MSTVSLQPADQRAVTDIVALLARTVPECSAQTVWDVPWSWRDYWVLRDGDTLVGTGALRPIDERRCELRGLAIDPRCRGRGLARRLLGRLITVAHAREHDLLCVTRHPKFFRRFGFSETHPFWLDLEPSRQPAVDAMPRVPMAAPYPTRTERSLAMNDIDNPRSQPHAGLDIRPATRQEMGLVADFVRSSADWYRPIVDDKDMGEHDVGDTWAEKNFALRDFYIGREGDTPIGTISVQYLGDWAYLGYIYLDVAYVGKGYGRRLIEFARQVAWRAGARGLTLIAHPDATWARKAYLKYGFEIVERDKEQVLAWQGGALAPYYEEGFELYMYEFDRSRIRAGQPRRRAATAQPQAEANL